MKINRLLATLLAGMLCFSLLGATAAPDNEPVPDLTSTPDIVDIDDEEIVLEFTLAQKGEIKSTVSADDFKFSYGFENMGVKSIEWGSDTSFSVALEGEINAQYPSGEISVLPSAFTKERDEVDITYDFIEPIMYLDYSGFSFADGVLKLPVTLEESEFRKSAAISDISVSTKLPLAVSGFELIDSENAVISLAAEGFESLDGVLRAIDDSADFGVTISANALNTIKSAKAESVNIPFASVVPVLDETVKNSDGTVSVLCRLSGYTADSAIKGSLIALGGDFAEYGGAVTVNEYGESLLSFKINPDKAIKDDYLISGTITLAPGALINPWGTPSEKQLYELAVSFEDAFLVPEETAEDVEDETAAETAADTMGFVPYEEIGTYSYMPYEDAPEADLMGNDLKDLALEGLSGLSFIPGSEFFLDPLKKLNSFYEFGVKVAEFFGWIPAKESANAKIIKTLNSINTQVENLTLKVDRLAVEIKISTKEQNIKAFSKELNSLHNFYGNFEESLKAKFRSQLNPRNITKARLDNGSAVEDALAGSSFDRLSAAEQEQARVLTKKAMENYFYSSTQPTIDKLIADLGGKDSKAYAVIMGNATEIVGLEFYHKSINGNTLYTSFFNVCDQITKPNGVLEDVDYVIDNTYNWEREAYPLRAAYRAGIDARLAEASYILTVCMYAYDVHFSADRAINTYQAAKAYYTTGAGKTTQRGPNGSRNEDYCITIKKDLRFSLDLEHPVIKRSQRPEYRVGNRALNETPIYHRKPWVLKVDDIKLIKMRANQLGRTLSEDLVAAGMLTGNLKTNIVGPLGDGETYNFEWKWYAMGYDSTDITSLNPKKILIIKDVGSFMDSTYTVTPHGFFEIM